MHVSLCSLSLNIPELPEVVGNRGCRYINNVASDSLVLLMIMETASRMLVTEFGSLAVCSPFGAEDGRIKWQGYIVSELPGERYLVRLLSWIDGLPCEDRLVRAEEVHKWSFYRTAEEMRYAWARESHMPTDRHIFAERAIAHRLREYRDVQAERT